MKLAVYRHCCSHDVVIFPCDENGEPIGVKEYFESVDYEQEYDREDVDAPVVIIPALRVR